MGVTAKQKRNLRPVTKKTARETGRRGGVKSGESRREKKLQRDILRDLLNTKLKNLPVDPETLANICQEYGLKTTILASEAHCVTSLIHALQGSHQYSRLLYEVDGSMEPETQETQTRPFIFAMLHPARESRAIEAFKRVANHLTPEEREDVRVFFDHLESSRKTKETIIELAEHGAPDLDEVRESLEVE